MARGQALLFLWLDDSLGQGRNGILPRALPLAENLSNNRIPVDSQVVSL
jgi:hypothetical protein